MAVQADWLEKDLYAVLGVAEDADSKSIKRAYRKLARELHPDTHPDDAGAAERFKGVTAAYDVLGDETKRAEYDEFRRAVAGANRGDGDGGTWTSSEPGGFAGNDEGWTTFDGSTWTNFDTGNIDAGFRFKYALDMLPFAQIYAYRTDAYKGAKPNSWADFWNTASFPGPRTLPAGSGGLAPDLEAATLAMGVPPDRIYPIDIDKAYASLAKIKPAVVKWWEAGAIPAQMLSDDEVAMAIAWNGRIAAIQEQGAPVE